MEVSIMAVPGQKSELEPSSIFPSPETYKKAAQGDEEAQALLGLWRIRQKTQIEILESELEIAEIDDDLLQMRQKTEINILELELKKAEIEANNSPSLLLLG